MPSILISHPMPWILRFAQDDHSAFHPPCRAPARRSLGQGGFTLVEILLVLALMALAAAALLPAAGALFRQGSGESPGELMTGVLQEVRREAVLAGRPVTLRFNAGTQSFAWDGITGGTRATPGPRLKVDFLRAGGKSAVLIGGQAVETDTVDSLTFYPDGTCDPVRVQLRLEAGKAEVLSIDPWTCAPGLEVSS
jgi:type II secretion system protein H